MAQAAFGFFRRDSKFVLRIPGKKRELGVVELFVLSNKSTLKGTGFQHRYAKVKNAASYATMLTSRAFNTYDSNMFLGCTIISD